ncbi:50S ribosomal protein L13 [Natranaerofaba carboxydovora]|uniref:50S ribosomal protein L13 n=1 Tax=Natranaerofaba carboxydovora TaxID=2742683 RepID=UPI001F14595C|nr:50S ribosomal protein L13 [Natranaerofaba carboxydovora]UMZ75426.1 50S ribosomal protein L13 [Natranaerofaba carboxydovora]
MKSTYMAKPGEVEKKWYVIDAAGKPLGRLAVEISKVLMGKHKPEYTPHVDTGDYVIVVNSQDVLLTGKKKKQKFLYKHSGFPGGLKATSYEVLLRDNPERAVFEAVKGMIPKNRLGRQMIKKLKVYRDSEHPHQAQQPESWDW